MAPRAESAAGESTAFGFFSSDKKHDTELAADGGEAPSPKPSAFARFTDKLVGTLTSAVQDLTELKVLTYTTSAGATTLRAWTKIQIDGDTEVCLPQSDDGKIDGAVWAAHMETVKQAQEHRAAMIKILLSLVPGVGPKA
jgi:hypothetical protein